MAQAPDKPAPLKPRNLLGVIRFLAKYPGQVALSTVLLLTIIGIEMVLPQITGNAITGLREHSARGTPFSPWPYVRLFFFLVVCRTGLGLWLGPVRNRLVQRTLGDIRAAIYDAMQRLTFTYHDRANTGELISRSTTDVWRLQDFLYACLFLGFDIIVSLVITISLIFGLSPLLGGVILGTMLPTLALIGVYAAKLQPQWRHVHDLHSAMTTVIQENIAGVRVVKAFAKEDAQVGKFRDRKEEFLGTLMRTVNYWAARVPFAQFLFGLSLPAVLWLGGRQVIRGELLIGDLAKVVLYLMAIGNRMVSVGQFSNVVQNASASAERILEILREPQLIRSGRCDLPAGGGEVVFDRVSFNYQEGKASLTDVTFTAQPGQTVAIVGPTGSGKSTLVHLIPRFYEVSAGRVRVEGIDVRELALQPLRRQVSVIFQDTFLFSTTVAENIAYGKPSATPAEVEAAARAAQAHEFILELEQGYQTVIGERGVTLSGGQKQRLAIARAFLMNPRILILDDATASVDAQTEHLIQGAMQRLARGRTTFVIAHRCSTVQAADLILVLQAGRVIERGTHSELLAGGGFYCEIFATQLAGREVAA